MADEIKFKEKYVPAKCCHPAPGDEIVGYFSHDDFMKVHRKDCASLTRVEPERIVRLEWSEITATDEFVPDDAYHSLDETDFAVLRHHRDFGIDYSLKVAAVLSTDKQQVFDSHKKLRELNLLERVAPVMVQYRKGVVDNKWIKHRNHTYYKLTESGTAYLGYHDSARS